MHSAINIQTSQFTARLNEKPAAHAREDSNRFKLLLLKSGWRRNNIYYHGLSSFVQSGIALPIKSALPIQEVRNNTL